MPMSINQVPINNIDPQALMPVPAPVFAGLFFFGPIAGPPPSAPPFVSLQQKVCYTVFFVLCGMIIGNWLYFQQNGVKENCFTQYPQTFFCSLTEGYFRVLIYHYKKIGVIPLFLLPCVVHMFTKMIEDSIIPSGWKYRSMQYIGKISLHLSCLTGFAAISAIARFSLSATWAYINKSQLTSFEYFPCPLRLSSTLWEFAR